MIIGTQINSNIELSLPVLSTAPSLSTTNITKTEILLLLSQSCAVGLVGDWFDIR